MLERLRSLRRHCNIRPKKKLKRAFTTAPIKRNKPVCSSSNWIWQLSWDSTWSFISVTHGMIPSRFCVPIPESCAACSIVSAEPMNKPTKCSNSIIWSRLPVSSLSRTAQTFGSSRPKFRSGNSWWKPIALISRRCRSAENAASPRTPGSSRKPSRRRAAQHSKKLLKPPPKPPRNFSDSHYEIRSIRFCFLLAIAFYSLPASPRTPGIASLSACRINEWHCSIRTLSSQPIQYRHRNSPSATRPEVAAPPSATGNCEKDRGSAPSGAVFKDRRPTGEVLAPDAPGRDPIVTRILWLRGLEAQNANAYGRYIYIHGTPEERLIGQPASFGCIRMKSRDVIQLFDIVGLGAKVTIANQPLQAVVPNLYPVKPTAEETKAQPPMTAGR